MASLIVCRGGRHGRDAGLVVACGGDAVSVALVGDAFICFATSGDEMAVAQPGDTVLGVVGSFMTLEEGWKRLQRCD